MNTILSNKYYDESSVFLPENLLREARRQKNKQECDVPAVCLLDPDGDLAEYLIENEQATKSECWACYHSSLYTFELDANIIGIIPCIVGSSYAVLVAEQLFVSGCRLLISVTSAGIINVPDTQKQFSLITSSIRDEGTSYHYLPPGKSSVLNQDLLDSLHTLVNNGDCPYFEGTSWTTDAPYRETPTSIAEMKAQHITCVEMEASALYALAEAKRYDILCFAHLTNSMALKEGDFEKGEEFGSIDTLHLITYVLRHLRIRRLSVEQEKVHWENIYRTKQPEEVSWTEEVPVTSLEFIHGFQLSKTAKIIDIGGGDSKLVDFLLDEGFEDITVLDISGIALERARLRLGDRAAKVKWVEQDITAFHPDTSFDLWHDRAAFHFLTTGDQITAYLSIARDGVKAGGYAIVGTFSDQGPDRCSGLPVKRYDERLLTEELSRGFIKIRCVTEEHITPFHTKQHFLFCSFRRSKEPALNTRQ
jgi:purine-nucleoside phosphorylase